MATQQEKNASLKINTEFFSLEPSSIISLFEIDLSEIGFTTTASSQFIVNLKNFQIILPGGDATHTFDYRVIRLHNNLKLEPNNLLPENQEATRIIIERIKEEAA